MRLRVGGCVVHPSGFGGGEEGADVAGDALPGGEIFEVEADGRGLPDGDGNPGGGVSDGKGPLSSLWMGEVRLAVVCGGELQSVCRGPDVLG